MRITSQGEGVMRILLIPLLSIISRFSKVKYKKYKLFLKISFL